MLFKLSILRNCEIVKLRENRNYNKQRWVTAAAVSSAVYSSRINNNTQTLILTLSITHTNNILTVTENNNKTKVSRSYIMWSQAVLYVCDGGETETGYV